MQMFRQTHYVARIQLLRSQSRPPALTTRNDSPVGRMHVHTTAITAKANLASHQPKTKSAADNSQEPDAQSDAYHHLDTDPLSSTPPYENPESSGEQLRYGGRDYHPKDGLEAFSERSKAHEGPDGTQSGGRQPEPDRR